MRCLLLLVIFCSIGLPVKPQTAEDIIAELKSINKTIADKPCSTGIAPLISNRAMNIFLADKTGYLSESRDLSFYTNYVTLNSTTGRFTINHNFQKAKGIDEPIKKLLSVGVYANIANSFAASFLDKKFENELGLTLNFKWLGKVKTHFKACTQSENVGNQKQAMDALRAAIVHSLEIEIIKKADDFNLAISRIDTADIPGQNVHDASLQTTQIFYKNLEDEYTERFATLQAEMLTQSNNFRLVTMGWTSLTAYLPLVFPTYSVAPSFNAPFEEQHPWPLELMLSHTRLWESSKAGRLFLTLEGNMLFNNSKLSYGLSGINLLDYKSLGGTDTLHLAGLKNDRAYTGVYETFITPSLKARVVYFLPSSHIGISFLIEQNFGSYDLLNGRLGIPIVLINRKKTPAANFEFYVSFFDMNGKIPATRKYGNKTAIGLGVGIPFSRLMY